MTTVTLHFDHDAALAAAESLPLAERSIAVYAAYDEYLTGKLHTAMTDAKARQRMTTTRVTEAEGVVQQRMTSVESTYQLAQPLIWGEPLGTRLFTTDELVVRIDDYDDGQPPTITVTAAARTANHNGQPRANATAEEVSLRPLLRLWNDEDVQPR